MTNGSRPFSDAAPTYLSRGWFPFPLPPAAKFPPPKGWTGYFAPYPSGADVQEWSDNGVGARNVGLRMADDVIGIDVDCYEGKPGSATLAEAVNRLGELPATYTSTARHDGESGIKFFRVPSGRRWADVLGPGVEIIHWGHRYAVVAPSVHPDTGANYVWRDSSGVVVTGPDIGVIPALPESWVADLDRGSIDDVDLKTPTTHGEAAEFLAALPAGPVCDYMAGIMESAVEQLSVAASRHDVTRKLSLRIVRAGEQGHAGTMTALDTLEALFHAAFKPGDRLVTSDEYARMVSGAVGICREKPTPEHRRHCCVPEAVFKDEDFWAARDVLGHIHAYAQGLRIAPWALLGACMARCVAATPYNVVLPRLVGGYGSLNFFVALCGGSGTGKGAVEAAAGECINFGEVTSVSVGSGEGIAHQYAKKTKEGVVRTGYQVLFSVHEVDSMTALGQRQGSTLLAELRKMWSGEPLGFAYSDPAKRLPIARHSYRAGLIMGIQPGRARYLLEDSDGGTPQRYVFLPTIDKTAPDEPSPAPEPIFWSRPMFLGTVAGKTVIELPDAAVSLVFSERKQALLGHQTQYDGHALLCRIKVAAALALLDGRTVVDDLDWGLSGTVMELSVATRDAMVAHLADQKGELSEQRAKAKAREQIIINESLDEQSIKRVARAVSRKLTADWQTLRDIKQHVNSRDRKHVEDAISSLHEAGLVEVNTTGGKQRFRAPE